MLKTRKGNIINHTINNHNEQLKILGRLTAQTAHELSNSIDGMTRFTSMAKSQLGVGQIKKATQYLNNIESGLKQMSVTLNDLLSYSKPNNTHTEINTVNQILRESICLFEQSASEKNINIITDFSLETDDYVLISGLLPGVFNNIIKNAIQATDSGQINIKTELLEMTIIVSIRDTGPGIPDKYINDIFRPFFTTKDKSEGTGLGLAISKEIIEKRGGTISAFNLPQGGCIFKICVPVDMNS